MYNPTSTLIFDLLGNPFLASVLSSLQLRPSFLHHLFPALSLDLPLNAVHLRLHPTDLLLDLCLPFRSKRLAFMTTERPGEVWPAIVCKALAKTGGGYERLRDTPMGAIIRRMFGHEGRVVEGVEGIVKAIRSKGIVMARRRQDGRYYTLVSMLDGGTFKVQNNVA